MAINKVVYGSTVLVDLTDDTVTPSTLLEGYTAHGADGAVITGTFVPEGGSAVVVTEEPDEHGGVIKHITAMDLSNDTVTAGALLNGYTAHDRQGRAIVGTLIPEGVDVSDDTVTSATLLSGYTAHDATGIQITGTYEPVDLSQDTVTSSTLLTGYTAHDSTGTLITGTYSAPDLSQDTVTSATLLSGYTAHDASGAAITGTFEVILEEINVTPTESTQTITPSSGYTGISEVNVGAISSTYVGSAIDVDPTVVVNGPNITVPTGYYSDDVSTTVTTTTVATPSINVSNSGLITATSSQNTGYVTGSTTSSTQQLTTKGATTITPNDTSQTAVSSGVYTTGAITVSAVPTETKTAIANGDVVPTTGKYLSKVTVAVPSDINNQDTTVTPTEAEQTITADAQHSGLGTVTVEAIDSNYVGSGVTRRSSTNLTVSGATVTAPAGYYSTAASKSVATTTLATPSVTIDNTTGVVTGSVTQTAGYVTAGTTSNTLSLSTQAATTITPNSTEQTAVAANKYTLGAVKVAAVPTETGSATPSTSPQTITPSSGYYLSSVSVGAIPSQYIVPSGTIEITSNGTTDVTSYATASVDVQPDLEAKTATPTESQQIITPSTGKDGLSQVTVGAISSTYVGSGIDRLSSTDLTVSGATVTAPAGYYSTAASKSVSSTTHPNPTATINSTTGVVTASHTQTAGYVSAGTTTYDLNLTTQAAATITPTTSMQTAVAAGKYTTGAVVVDAIPSSYKNLTTTTTATASDILETKTAYNNSGTLMTGSLHIVKYFTGSTTPSSSVGDDGDIYLMS